MSKTGKVTLGQLSIVPVKYNFTIIKSKSVDFQLKTNIIKKFTHL